MATPSNALERWADRHRELMIMGVALPLSKLASIGQRLTRWRTRSDPRGHDARVARVMADVHRYATARQVGEPWALRPLRTDRKGTSSLNVRVSDKSRSCTVTMSDLNAILAVDRERGVVRVEPFATVGEVARHLDDLGLQLETTIEMEDATLGGLVMALGLTTHSHIAGLVHDTVTAFEIVTAQGRLVRATADNEHADLFRALPWSHGTLGLLVAIELRVIPAPSHVRLVYRPFFSLADAANAYRDTAGHAKPPPFVEMIAFGRDRVVMVEGHFATDDEVKRSGVAVNHINRFYKPLFYKHVESQLELGQDGVRQEYVRTYDYLMRHERSMCMTLAEIMPSANAPWFRYTMGWMLPPNMTFLKGLRPPEERIHGIRRQVWQDFSLPAEHFEALISRIDDDFGIYPLLIYPSRVFDHGGFVRVPGRHGQRHTGPSQTALFVDVGIFGTPKRVRDGDTRFPTITKLRQLERMVRGTGGFLHTYCDIFSTADEFEEMFDHTLWHAMRARYQAEGTFPTIYEKVKPEIDVAPFLAEERAWQTFGHPAIDGEHEHDDDGNGVFVPVAES